MPVPELPLIDTPEQFAKRFNVSRETLERLKIYEQLLKRWQKGTNLVSPATLDQVWHRHFADSAQLITHASDAANWLDLGSGAGFPGLVVAICRANQEDGAVHLVESNARKCAFAHEVVRETGCSVEIHQTRIESLWGDDKLSNVECVTARALAPLSELLELAAPFFGASTRGLFLKGRQTDGELSQARQKWSFEPKTHPSLTDVQARVVELRDLRQKGSVKCGEDE